MHLDDRARLVHMIEAAEQAVAYAAGIERDAYFDDRMRIDATVRCIEVIGEAANNVSGELQSEHAEVPWRVIVGMRNRLVHAYFAVDEEIVWETVQHELPKLLDQIRPILSTLD